MTNHRAGVRGERGFAIGPILMVITLIAVVGLFMSAGSSTLSASITTDRTAPNLSSQADLIRAKILECWSATQGVATAGYPVGVGVAVGALNCPGDPAGSQNLWTGARPTILPLPPQGFGAWSYSNDASGIRIQIAPVDSAHAANSAIQQAIQKSISRYSSVEGTVDSATQTVTVWIHH